jgi:hypothetical protein
MRMTLRRRKTRSIFLAGFLVISLSAASTDKAHQGYSLDIRVLPDGSARVHAQVELAGPPDVARLVLTDYEHWPDLFPPGLRIAGIRREARGVITDLWATRHILPGELHLVTETRETTPDRLDTSLVEGDFHRYTRTWQLSPGPSEPATTATLEMEVQPKGWVPDWLFTIFLKQDLEAHFVLLQTAVAARARR